MVRHHTYDHVINRSVFPTSFAQKVLGHSCTHRLDNTRAHRHKDTHTRIVRQVHVHEATDTRSSQYSSRLSD